MAVLGQAGAALFAWLLAFAFCAGAAADTLSPRVDRVAAVPSVNGHADERLLPLIQTTEPGLDGQVRLRLSRDYDWVLLLLDDDGARPEQRLMGYVSVAGRGHAPGPKVSLARLASSTQVLAGTSIMNVSIGIDTLRRLSRDDDGYRQLINLYLNYEPRSATWYLAEPRQVWNAGALSATVNRQPDPGSYRFRGYGLELRAHDPELEYRSLCEGSSAVGLFPPAEVRTDGGLWFGQSQGIATGDRVWEDEPRCVSGRLRIERRDDGVLRFEFPADGDAGELLQRMPKGWWQWMRPHTGLTLASLDLGVDSPLTRGGHAVVFVPVPRMVVGADQRIRHVAIDWMRYNVVRSSYVPAELEVMSALVYSSYVRLDGEQASMDAAVDPHKAQPIRAASTNGLNGPWVPQRRDPGEANSLESLTVGYKMGGVEYRFTWQ